jgi:hypothetical protein
LLWDLFCGKKPSLTVLPKVQGKYREFTGAAGVLAGTLAKKRCGVAAKTDPDLFRGGFLRPGPQVFCVPAPLSSGAGISLFSL